jgi:hypothetical protein
MLRTTAALLCFLPLMLAVAAAPQPRSSADTRASGAAASGCRDDGFEQYLRWHNEAAHRMTVIVSVGEHEDRARPVQAARECAADPLSIRGEGERS